MRARLKIPMKALFLILLLLILSVPVLTINPTQDPTPTIRVVFDPEDAPLTNVYGQITHIDSDYTFVLNGVLNQSNIYDFYVDTFLFPGEYLFFVSALDNDNNLIEVEDAFTVLESDDKIWVVNPLIPYFQPETQKISLGHELPYNLEIETKVPSVCKLKKFTPPIPSDLEQQFLGSGILFNGGNQDQTTVLARYPVH